MVNYACVPERPPARLRPGRSRFPGAFSHRRPLGQNRSKVQVICCAKGSQTAMMLITNKHKTSKKAYSKTDASGRIRRLDFDSPHKPPAKRKRRDHTACPTCDAHIPKTASGGRRMYACSNCGATLNRQLVCKACSTARVWQGKKGAACAGCGAVYDLR